MSDINIKKEVSIQNQPIPVPIEGIKKDIISIRILYLSNI